MAWPEKCSHGVPFLAVAQHCVDCDIEWERSCIQIDEESLERHRKRLAELLAEKEKVCV